LINCCSGDGGFEEAFVPEYTLDPAQQHLYEVICHRALNPNAKEIPEPSENVRKNLKPPAELEEQVKPVLEVIRSLFPLVEKIPKEGARKAAADLFKQESDKAEVVEPEKPNAQPSTIKKIGTISPVADFHTMLEEKQLPFQEGTNVFLLPRADALYGSYRVLILVLKTRMRTVFGCVLSKGCFCSFGEKGKFTRELTTHG